MQWCTDGTIIKRRTFAWSDYGIYHLCYWGSAFDSVLHVGRWTHSLEVGGNTILSDFRIADSALTASTRLLAHMRSIICNSVLHTELITSNWADFHIIATAHTIDPGIRNS
jgi:hypothetical protein